MREFAGETHVILHVTYSETFGTLTLMCFFLVNKQLGDKERVAAALENAHLLKVINQCLDFRQ